MTAWFNEIEPYPAAWLRNLWPGAQVDERDIRVLAPGDVPSVDRAHFFAGIGGWEHALDLACWPADEPVWTGSCPCQPFSAAGRRRGTSDERHLWPDWLRLIAERRPPVVFGEQVASRLGRQWLAGVRTDLEDLGYAVGAADLCAASVGAPHIRQRLFWVAEPAESRRREQPGRHGREDGRPAPESGRLLHALRLGQSRGAGLEERPGEPGDDGAERAPVVGASGDARWRDAVFIPCLDGKARRIEPGVRPLAHGVPARVGRLRAYGNAIVPQVAATFIRAYLDARA